VKLRGWARKLQRPRRDGEEALWPRALTAGRAASTALTLLIFVAALTVDDLRIFRFSSALVGSGLAIVVFAATPPFSASRLVERALSDAPASATTWMENALLRRRALLGFTIALLVVWLVFFASGRTPRW